MQRLEEATEQVDYRALAAARGPHQRNHLARLHGQREVAQDLLAVLIAKVHLVEDDLAAHGARIVRTRFVGDVGHGILQREDALG